LKRALKIKKTLTIFDIGWVSHESFVFTLVIIFIMWISVKLIVKVLMMTYKHFNNDEIIWNYRIWSKETNLCGKLYGVFYAMY
jgi:galactitol-specific phosphotransferase system IIC component